MPKESPETDPIEESRIEAVGNGLQQILDNLPPGIDRDIIGHPIDLFAPLNFEVHH